MGYYFPVLGGGTKTFSNFGQNRGSHLHQGIDIAAPSGTGVIAPIDMTVLRTGYQAGGAGNYVVGQDASGYQYKFFHLQGLDVQAGQQISGGSVFANVGNTGRSTGSHLHFEVRDAAGNLLNPSRFLSGSSVISKGKEILGNASNIAKKALDTALKTNPATAPFVIGAEALGINPLGSDCGIICQIQKWISESQFFQRLGLALLAIVVIGGGLMLLGKGVATKQIQELVKT